jgi:PAS domain S-box-containing protein
MRKTAFLFFLFILFLGSLSVKGHPGSGTGYTQQMGLEYQEKMEKYEATNPMLALKYADSLEMVGEALADPAYLYAAYKKKGDINRRLGQLPTALRWLKKALELSRDLRDTLSMVKAYNNLGAVYYNNGIFDKALKNFSQANLLGDKVLSKKQKARVLMNLGMVHYELGQNADALAFYKSSLDFNQQAADSLGLAYAHNHLGRLYYRQNEGEKALAHYRLARKIHEKQESETGLAEALTGIAMVYLKDSPDISLEYLRLANKLYLKNNSKTGLFQLNRQAGETYQALANFPHALIHFNIALAYADSLGNVFQRSQVLLNIAGLQEEQGNFEEASRYYRQYVTAEKEVYKQGLVENIAYTKADYALDKKEDEIKSLEQQAAQTSSQLRWRNRGLLLAGLLSLLTIVFGFISAIKYRSEKKANSLLKARNELVHRQKTEIEEQHQLIQRKSEELEKARQKNEHYNKELLSIKEILEEKVRDRTKELEEIYIKLSFHIHNTPLAVLEWNNRRELVHWPKQAESIFGYSAEEMLGLRIEEVPFVLPDDRQEVLHTIEQLSRGEVARHYSTQQHINRDGQICYVEWIYSVLLNESGELESVLTIANDVSLREQTYRELKSANQELDTFLYKSSHDLRGPIARMQGIINLGLLETADPNARMYFNMLNKVTDELNNLLLRLLMVHNINQHVYALEEIAFRPYVDSLIANYAGRRRSLQEVEIINKIPENMVVHSDPTLLNIVLVNLLENGLMFADNFHPRIEFDAIYLPSGKYIIMVSDNGMGIPEQFREKIFDMFFQGSTRSTGTGLGLYMVRKATKKMGGDIRLTSENGQTVFEITLPAAKAQPIQETAVVN